MESGSRLRGSDTLAEQLLHESRLAGIEAGYLHRVATGVLDEVELRAIGFPWSERMVERSRRSRGATLSAAREALTPGDDSVFTFCIHGARNFPFFKEAGDLDIELADGTRDAEYLWHLECGLDETLETARRLLQVA